MGARFTVTSGAELLKGMTSGRVQLPKGENAIDSVVRRIQRETGLRFVTLRQDACERGDDGEVVARHYEILLGRGRAKSIAGAVHVTITTGP